VGRSSTVVGGAGGGDVCVRAGRSAGLRVTAAAAECVRAGYIYIYNSNNENNKYGNRRRSYHIILLYVYIHKA